MILRLFLVGISLTFFCSSCDEDKKDSENTFEPINLAWKVDSFNDKNKTYNCELTIHNLSDFDLTADNWSLHYTEIGGAEFTSLSGNISSKRVMGSYFKISPGNSFKILKSGESRTISYEYSGNLRYISYIPAGFFLVVNEEMIWEGSGDIAYFPEGFPNEWKDDSYPTPQHLFEVYEKRLSNTSDEVALPPFIPAPQKYSLGKGYFSGDSLSIWHPRQFENESLRLGEILSRFYRGGIYFTEDSLKANLILKEDLSVEGIEGYKLNIETDKIQINANSSTGIFYGVQSLAGLLPLDKPNSEQLTLPILLIEDQPKYGYRGLHIDLARNFKSLDAIKKVIDIMAFYKLNFLNLQLADDEGWRIEIDGLPELTEVGSKRGYTRDEKDRLYPAYGSGGSGDLSGGNGFYSKNEFVELLNYAKDRHIDIIPKIDMPGHARAAIKSMESRYHNLLEVGKKEEAEEYLLTDPEDESKYRSVQNYTDNVVDVCKESTYRFLDKVIFEIQSIYQSADIPLEIIHIGGDEVPDGVWEGSPSCKTEFTGTSEDKSRLFSYFMDRVNNIVVGRGLIMAGWEEIAQVETDSGRVTNQQFLDRKILPYVWHREYAYPLANGNYAIILANSENLYFDLAYDYHPMEPGLHWAGTVSEYESFILNPENLFRDGGDSLREPENIIGLQAQLWSETILNDDMMEYYLYPKILGLSQNSWSGSVVQSGLEWSAFSSLISEKELRRLEILQEGINYRLPPPGARIENGKLIANASWKGLGIKYMVNGQNPMNDGLIYEAPVEVKRGDQIILVSYFNEKVSRESIIKYE